MKKSIIGLLLTLVLVLSLCYLIVACGDDTPDSSSSTNSTGNSDPVSSTAPSTEGSKPGDDDDKNEDVLPPQVTGLLKVDYATMTYVGTSLKDFSAMFDEQSLLGDPMNDKQNLFFPKSIVPRYDADGNGDITAADDEHIYEVTIDLGAEHYIECIYVFFEHAGDSITFETGEPFKYDNTISYTCETMSWAQVDFKLKTRYINVKFNNGQASSELMLYGYRTGKYDAVNTEKHNYKTFDYFLGINGNQSDKKTTLGCANYFRDYVNWLWCFDRTAWPSSPGTTFSTYMSQDYDSFYRSLNKAGIDSVPCYMFRATDFPVNSVTDYMKPETYVMYGEFLFQAAVRFGHYDDIESARDLVKVLSLQKRCGLDAITWIEAGNEPNGEGNDGFAPYELAALTSTSYDGHCGTVLSPTGSGVGVINAGSNVKMSMAGLAGVGTRYIQAMSFWLKHNRADGTLGLDAFNVHTYCKKLVKYNGYQVYVGVCPEIGRITEYVVGLCEWRDKYYPDIEVWLTEFGWDTNTSYQTENACHPYADFTARELQAMWLVRAYFMFAAAGVDRCAMYMAPDGGPEDTTVGKYGTSGVIASNGEYKDSYYYIYTLKNTMGDMYFAEVIDSGNENVWIYRFENGKGKSCYAVWCPTMDDVRVNDYVLNIDGTSATMTEFANLDTDGVSSQLTVTDGKVSVNVSEVPVLIFSE